MVSRITSVTGFLCVCFLANAQETVEGSKSNQYVGVQANQLIRQLLPFSNNSTAIQNPYLLTYAVNSSTTGVGFTAGLGYNYNQFEDGDALTPRNNTQSLLALRVGIDKKKYWSKRWMASWGIDLLIDHERNKTESTFNGPNGSPQKTTSDSKKNGSGLGPRMTINFAISERILVGTESSYYFKSFKQITTASFSSVLETKGKSFNLLLPSVLYLYFKF